MAGIDEEPRLWRGIPLRPRRAGCLCRRKDYFPEDLEPRRYYQPVPRGLELKIRDKLEHLAELDRTSPRQRRKS